MEFNSFNLSFNKIIPSDCSRANKPFDANMYSYPLTGHLNGEMETNPIDTGSFNPRKFLPEFKMSVPFSFTPQPFVIGGFVGSKSQRNECNYGLFPIGKLIDAQLLKKEQHPSKSSQIHLMEVVSNIIMGIPETMKEFGMGVLSNPEPTRNESQSNCMTDAEVRLLSECSNDSGDFIIFDDRVEESDSDVYEEDDDDEEQFSDESDGEYDTQACNSVCFSSTLVPLDFEDEEKKILMANAKWKRAYGSSPDKEMITKVRFKSTPQIHTMHVWDFAHRQARLGQWEQLARDRDRFSKRIAKTEDILAPILTPEHRAKVWLSLQSESTTEKPCYWHWPTARAQPNG